MHSLFSLITLFVILFLGCTSTQLSPVKIDTNETNITYSDVKPIIDKRCVVCHSCYNSPCQAKFSSFEGIDRGASKIAVYNATRLEAQDPTRLFIDAQSTPEWRTKGFFSLTDSNETNISYNNSLMLHLLYEKKIHPDIIGDYDPEHDTLTCAKDTKELASYIEKKPNHGMPYGFPAITPKEYAKLQAWIAEGTKSYTSTEEKKIKTPSFEAQKQIKKWEAFFNTPDPKHQMTARYLYEHLYLAHLYFPNAQGEFFELVRSTTPSPESIKIIPSLRPFDDPQTKHFYYRFRKIHATLVHKTHMTFTLDDTVLKRWQELFIATKWLEKPHLVDYNPQTSTNPFVCYKQIPPSSRYKFLLDNAHYIVMTFIRGPVCRGQMALNVIHDHFWVMFQDPNYDVGVLHPEFLIQEAHNLALPIENVNKSVFETFSDAYRKKYERYYHAKVIQEKKNFPKGFGYESLWKGNKADDAPLLTVYRHFDSASVHKGVLGELPRTMWVIDYAQFERIYYTLVAGYDVFGNISHQTNIRRYMDFLRIEGELNFLNYMPKNKRLSMLRSWYINDNSVDEQKYQQLQINAQKIHYTSNNPKREFIEYFVNHTINKATNIHFDTINYTLGKEDIVSLPTHYNSIQNYMQAAKAVSVAGSGFISRMTDSGANNIYLRIDMPDGTFYRKSLIINRWHNNVNSLFNGKSNLNPKKDTMDILDGSVGSYPNVFVVVKLKDLPKFLELMKNYDGSSAQLKQLKHYFISRSDKNFWKIYDWFQQDFYDKEPINSGLYDLNRYARTPWKKEN